MASKYTAYRIVLCGDATDVDQVGVGKLLAEGWELYGQPWIRNNWAVYQVMVKPAVPVVDPLEIGTEPEQTGHPWAGA